MTQVACPSTRQSAGYRHEAFLWRDMDELLDRTTAFVADGLAEKTPVMVAAPAEHARRLRESLGSDAAGVHFVDIGTVGRNPARIIPVWSDFLAEHGAERSPVRAIIEPVWSGRRPAELAECLVHEAALNLAVPTDVPVWLMCPYEAAALDPALLDGVRRSHPSVTGGSEGDENRVYAGPGYSSLLAEQPLPEPPGRTEEVDFARGGLAVVRRLVTRHAEAAGIPGHHANDLVLAVNEVAANSLDHGGGQGLLRAWREPGALVFEVRDRGRITDPLVGRVNPQPGQVRGRGLWMVNRLCDLLQIRSTGQGTVIRVVTWLS